MNKRLAVIASFVFVILSFFMAIQYTFFEPKFFRSLFNISTTFLFFYFFRNPDVLMSRNMDELYDSFMSSRDRKFFYGTTPFYPASLLLAICYISAVKYGFPLDLTSF